MSAVTASANIRTGSQTMRRIRPVAVQQNRRFAAGAFFARTFAFLVFLVTPVLFLFVPSKPETVVALAVGVVVVMCILRWPIVGTFSCLVLAILVDSLPSVYSHTILSELGVFRNLSTKGLPQAFMMSMFEIVVALTLASALFRRFHAHQKSKRGAMAFAILAYTGVVMMGEANGVLTGGDFKISLWELRPLAYVAVLYLLAVNTVSKPWHIRALLWISVVGIAARCLEGVSRFFGMTPDLRAIVEVVLEHDDSMLFAGIVAVLVPVLIWRKYLPKRFVWSLVGITPLVLYVIEINHRRAAYFCIMLGVVAMLPLIWKALPSRQARVRMAQVLSVIAVISPIYLAVYWNSSGTLAKPAAALRSVIAPDERDYLSNLYRDQENMNLNATIALNPAIGVGFGKPMLEVVKMVDLTDIWALQLYMPHNNMLWLWMRMGLLGFSVFWMMVGSVIILVAASVRIAIKRLEYLVSVEKQHEPGEEYTARGLRGEVAGLRVVHLKPKNDEILPSHMSEQALVRAHKSEVQECVEFMILAFLALAMLVSMLTLAVVDQGLMSPRLSTYWGLLLGTLAVGWEMYRVKFRVPSPLDTTSEQDINKNNYKELDRAKRQRMRVIELPSNAA